MLETVDSSQKVFKGTSCRVEDWDGDLGGRVLILWIGALESLQLWFELLLDLGWIKVYGWLGIHGGRKQRVEKGSTLGLFKAKKKWRGFAVLSDQNEVPTSRDRNID